MEIKMLSSMIGHVSSGTTLNIYTHITNEMQENAAASIDCGIAKTVISEKTTEKPSEEQIRSIYGSSPQTGGRLCEAAQG